MEDKVTSAIFHGFNLVKDLEKTLLNQHSTEPLSKSLDEIVETFSSAKQQLMNAITRDRDHNELYIDHDLLQLMRSNVGVKKSDQHKLLMPQAMDSIQNQPDSSETARTGKESVLLTKGMPSSSGGKGIIGSSGSSSQRRRRKEEEKRTILRVPAPRMGNTEIPPDDNYTWRKYGQKEILGSIFPRSYYRCTHQKMYNCLAKKQVQRLDNNPLMFLVTYRGNHTCHMSATAPSIAPPPPPPPKISSETTWLSMEFGPPLAVDHGGGGGPTCSSVDHTYHPLMVADMADVMFNSGSSSGNSMDFIFPNSDHHHED